MGDICFVMFVILNDESVEFVILYNGCRGEGFFENRRWSFCGIICRVGGDLLYKWIYYI